MGRVGIRVNSGKSWSWFWRELGFKFRLGRVVDGVGINVGDSLVLELGRVGIGFGFGVGENYLSSDENKL